VSARNQTRLVRRSVLCLCVTLLFLAIATLQGRIDASARIPVDQEVLILRSGPLLKKMSLGYDSLLADIYWTRAVQYYGQRVQNPGAKLDLLWPLLDITTTLDPHLLVAYRFGAIFLSEPEAGADRPDLAIELVERGIAANPNEWRLGTDLGFLYYWHLKDYARASAAYLAASQVPHAPLWPKLMAARIAQTGGSFDISRMIWSQLYESTNNSTIKARALRELRSLKAQEDQAQLDMLAKQYQERFGHFPATITDMVTAGFLSGIPVDPAGIPYVLGPDGKSRLDRSSPVEIDPPPKIRPH
jgi:hypothetical protein